ncbi:hypothetical protein F4824DRAFT_502214 [Ustulina deusta]|nr:hypothetical protein F4824DRAFT_502214 [Ustulina deusta]
MNALAALPITPTSSPCTWPASTFQPYLADLPASTNAETLERISQGQTPHDAMRDDHPVIGCGAQAWKCTQSRFASRPDAPARPHCEQRPSSAPRPPSLHPSVLPV